MIVQVLGKYRIFGTWTSRESLNGCFLLNKGTPTKSTTPRNGTAKVWDALNRI